MNNSSMGSPQVYANQMDSANANSPMSRSYDGGLTYAQYKNQLRPKGGFYSQYSGKSIRKPSDLLSYVYL